MVFFCLGKNNAELLAEVLLNLEIVVLLVYLEYMITKREHQSIENAREYKNEPLN